MRQRLTAHMMNVILEAERADDKAMHLVELERGALVEVRIRDQMFTLRLSRAGILPSASEWMEILQALPEAYKPMATVLPSDYDENGRWYLTCTYPLRTRERMRYP